MLPFVAFCFLKKYTQIALNPVAQKEMRVFHHFPSTDFVARLGLHVWRWNPFIYRGSRMFAYYTWVNIGAVLLLTIIFSRGFSNPESVR